MKGADLLIGETIGMKRVIADRGYDANRIRAALREQGTIPVIPGRRNRKGTVRISVCGRAVKHYAAMALMKRSPNRTANWALAMDHSRGGIFHVFSDRFKIRYSSLVAASSLGKCPLALTARRS